MEKIMVRKNMLDIFLVVLCACLLLSVLAFVYLDGYSGWDITGHWRICRYALEGYNPYMLIAQEPVFAEIGEIPSGFSTVPWACVFGSFFYGGFMPLNWAKMYNFVLHLASLAAVLGVVYYKLCNGYTQKQQWVLLLIPVAHFSLMYSIRYGNAGGVICCLLIITFFASEDYPLFSGFLLGMSMMKPQIAGIVCLAYLLRRQWRVLFTAAAVVVSGWILSAVATSTSPLLLLVQTLETGTAATGQYLGLLNNLKYIGVESKIILLVNVAIGAIYVIYLHGYLVSNKVNSVMMFVPACIASTFWIYKNGTDYLIVVFAAVLLCVLCMGRSLRPHEYMLSAICLTYLVMGRGFVNFGIALFEQNLFVRDLFKSADGALLALIGTAICRLWVKYEGEALLKTKNEE